MPRTSSVTLGPLQTFVDQLVRSGRYTSSSEVIRDALRLLQEKEAASSLAQLRLAIEEGDNSKLIQDWNAGDFLKRMGQGSSKNGDIPGT